MSTKTSLDEIAEILSNYFNSVTKIELIKHGFDNENYYIEADGDRYVLRIYNNIGDDKRSKEAILEEISFINFFHNHGIKTPGVIADKNGELVLKIDDRFCAVFDFCTGSYVYARLKPIHFTQIGELIGRVHSLTEQNKLATKRQYKDKSVLGYLSEKVTQGAKILDQHDNDLYRNIQNDISLFERTPLWFTHNDYHFGNILFNGDDLSALLDFDGFILGHFANDIARFLMIDLSYSSLSDYHIERSFIEAFFNGYLAQRQLSTDDKNLISLYFDVHYLFQKIRLDQSEPEKVAKFKEEIIRLKDIYSRIFE